MATLAIIHDADDLIKLVVMGGLILLGIVWVVLSSIARIVSARQREISRREVAAYVAEGSISPQDAAVLLNAGDNDLKKKIADGLFWGAIKPADAAAMLNPQPEKS